MHVAVLDIPNDAGVLESLIRLPIEEGEILWGGLQHVTAISLLLRDEGVETDMWWLLVRDQRAEKGMW